MYRLKTFRNYCLCIIAFYIFSNIASNVLITNSYANLSEATNVIKSDEGITVETVNVKANRRQGIFTGKVINTSDYKIDKKYIRIRAYDGNILLQTRYLTVTDLKPKESREFSTKFTADEIDSYKVDFTNEVPIERTILDDAIDKVVELINDNKDKKIFGENGKISFNPLDVTEYNVPNWAWLMALGIVIYYIPSGAIWFII